MDNRDGKSSSYHLIAQDCWGIASFRSCNGFPTSWWSQKSAKPRGWNSSDLFYDCVLGCYIVRWNISRRQRVVSFQASEDLVMCLLKSPVLDLAMSVAYSGNGAIWNKHYWKQASFDFPSQNITDAAWSQHEPLFGITSKGPNGRLCVYSVKIDKGKTRVTLLTQIVCPQESTMPVSIDQKYSCYSTLVFTPASEIVAIYEPQSKPCEVHLYSANGSLQKRAQVNPLRKQETYMECISRERKDIICVGIQDGLFQFVSCSDVVARQFFKAPGSPQACLWDQQLLLTVASLSGNASWWNQNGKVVKEVSGAPQHSVAHLNWEQEGTRLWIGGLMSLYFAEIPKVTGEKMDIKYKLEKHLLSGCGIAINCRGLTASGDLTGNILIWRQGNEESLYQANIGEMVRCLSWCKDSLLIGTLDGHLYLWSTITALFTNTVPKIIFTTEGGITCLSVSDETSTMILGTTTGHVVTFTHDANLTFSKTGNFLVHPPQSKKVMEVWSVCLSPSSDAFASASEDQSCCISSMKTGTKLATLKGHTMAVTSVKWKSQNGRSSCLATCSDDRTVRVYDGDTYTLQFVLNTYDIQGWHTLTYLDLDPHAGTLLCCTQNGYVVGWDLDTRKCFLKKRVHNGSIEGLTYAPNYTYFGTIGSDGTVYNFSIVYVM